jgi:hypothetical protein
MTGPPRPGPGSDAAGPDQDAAAPEPPARQLTAEQLEAMRSIGLRLDRAGGLWHRGAPVTHPRLRRAILRWLDVGADGRDRVRLDDTRYAWIDVEDAHLRVRSARLDGDRVRLVLDDDTEEELAYPTVWLGDGDALYCRVRGARLRARFSTAAQASLAPLLEEDPAAPSGFALRAAGARWPVA